MQSTKCCRNHQIPSAIKVVARDSQVCRPHRQEGRFWCSVNPNERSWVFRWWPGTPAEEYLVSTERERTIRRSENSCFLLEQRKTCESTLHKVSVICFHVFPRPQILNGRNKPQVFHLRRSVFSCFRSPNRQLTTSTSQSSVTMRLRNCHQCF